MAIGVIMIGLILITGYNFFKSFSDLRALEISLINF